MAGDNELIITAELDTATTISNIQGQLKDTVQPALQGILQVDCSIKSDSISAMKNQLSEITKGITLDVSKIQVADVNTAVVEQNISKSLSNISPQVQITPKIKTKVLKTDLLNSIPQQFADTADVTDKVTQKFLGLKDVVSKVSITDITAPNGQIESFTAKVTESTGAVRDFKYSLEDVGNGIMAFNLKSTKGNNVGIEKQLQQNAKVVDDYTSKVNNLKAQMGEDFTKGFSSSFESFSSTLNNFKNGTATVEEVRHSFIILENEIKTAKSLLRGGDKSLNEFDNARTSARDLDRTLIQIQTDFKNLSDTRKTGELSRSINDIETKMQSLKDIEKKDGFSNEWVKKYAELKITLRDVQSEIKLAKKLEQEDASSGLKRTQTLLKEINDSYNELIKNTKLYYKNGISEKEANTYSTRGVNAIDKFNNAKVSLIREGLYTPEIKERIKVLEENHSILKENLKTEKEYALVLEEENKQIAQLDKEQRIRKLTSKQSNLTDSLNNLQTTDKSKIQQDLNTVQDKINSLNNFRVNSVQWKQTYGEIDELLENIKSNIKEASQAETNALKEQNRIVDEQLKKIREAENEKKKMQALLDNPKSSQQQKQFAISQISEEQAKIDSAVKRLQIEGLYNETVEREIAETQQKIEKEKKINALESERIKTSQAETNALKEQKRIQDEQLRIIKEAENENVKYLKIYNSLSVSSKKKERANELIRANFERINQSVAKLKNEKLYTDETKKQIENIRAKANRDNITNYISSSADKDTQNRKNLEQEVYKDLQTIQDAEQKVSKYLKIYNSSSALQETKNNAQKRIAEFSSISKETESKLSDKIKNEVSYNEEIKKSIELIRSRERILREDNYASVVDKRVEQQLKVNQQKRDTEIKAIEKAEKEITSQSQKYNSPTILEENKVRANELIEQNKASVQQSINRLKNEKLLNSETEARIQQIQREQQELRKTNEISSSAEKNAQAKKKQQQESVERINQQIQAFKNAEKKKTEYYKLWKNPNSNEELQNAKEQYVNYSSESKQAESLLKADSAYTDSVEKRIQAIKQEQVEERIKFNAHVEGAKRIKAENEQLKEEESRYKEISKLIADYTKKLQAFNSSTTAKNNSSNENVQSQVAINQNLITQLSAMSESLGKDKSATNVANLKTQLDALTTSLEQATADSINLENALKGNSAEETKESKLRNLQSQLKSFANTNQKAVTSLKTMSNGGTFAGEYQRLVEMASRTDLDKNGIAKLTEDFRNFKAEAKASGLTAERFFSGMGNQLRMITSRWFSLYAIIGKIKSMIDNVKSLDTAMISLKRVTTGTSEEYQKFLETAQISARNTYSSWSDTVEQASRWAKAGYSLEESAELAKTSLIYSKVGDVDNTTAVGDLVTAMRGFNITAKDSLSIVDKLDILNNKYATDAKSLGEALTVSSSAMATAGNSLDQTLALITGGAEITQNAKEMGTALRTISMRIRSMKGQLEELGEEYENVESVSKIQTQILNLTKGKVNIFDSNNNFRSTYDILKDISEIYETLSDPDKATLSEILFGKTRGNQGLAIINAFRSGQISKAFDDAVNSAGTATDEMDAYAKGMEAHISTFKERVEELSGAMFDNKRLKGFIDLGTQLISMLTEATKHIGLLGTAITAVVGAMTFKGVNPYAWWKEYKSIPQISEQDACALRQYNNLLARGIEQEQARSIALANSSRGAKQLAVSANGAAVAENTLAAATNKLTIFQRGLAVAATIAKTALLSIGTMAIMAGITAIINAFSKGIDKAKEAKLATEESREDAVQTAKAYEEEANKLSGIYSKYINLIATTQDLSSAKEDLKNIQQEVNDSYDNEAKKIDLVNGNIAENIRLLREQQKAEAEKQAKKSQGKAEVAEQNLQKVTTYRFNAVGLGSFLKDGNGEFAKKLKEAKVQINEDAFDKWYQKETGLAYDFTITGTLKEQIDVLTQIRDIYADIDGHSAERLNQLDNEISKLQTEYDQEKKIVDQHETDVANAESFANPEIAKGITDITEKYQDFQSAIEKGDINKAFDLKDEIESTKDSLVAMSEIGSNDRDTILGLFDSLDLSMEKAKSSLAISTQEIQKYIDDSFGSSFEQLDKIDKAVQTLTDGDLLSSTDAWNLMDKIDSDGILKDIEVIGGKYKMSTQELISLRNKLIDQQLEILKNDKEEAKTSLKSREQDLKVMGEKIKQLKDSGINNAGDQTLLNNLMTQYDIISDEIAQAKVKIVENEYAQQEFNDRLNVTLDLTKAIKAETDAINKKVKVLNDEISTLETEMENYLKAQEYVVDSIVKKKEKEKKILENEKTALEEQLSVLEKQKENIEQIVSKYDTASSAVTGAIKSQIEELENSRQSVEDYYDSMIEKLREENDERESAVEYAEKLANLENAKNNKVKTYSSARGWEWIADKSAVQDAQNNLDSFVNEQKISQLEKEKEQALTPYNQQISDLEKYEEEWSKVADSVKQAQDEIIASEMFGADWHEKILNKDIQLLETYRSEYSAYSNELNTLDTVDIADLQEQIKLKEEQISAIDKSIQGWNDYKTEIQDSATAIKETLESYMAYVNTVAIDENSSYEQRMANLANFTQNYSSKISELTAKKQEVKDLEDELLKLENTNTELILETEGAVRQLSEETDEIDTKSKTIIGRAWETIKEWGEKYANAIDVANEESNIKLDTANKVSDSADKSTENLKDGASHIESAFDSAQKASDTIKQTLDDTGTDFQYKIKVTSDDLVQSANEIIESLDRVSASSDVVKNAIDGVLKLAGYSSGGVDTSTGLAMLHGTPNSPEVVFNAKDAVKLYNLVHDTSNLSAEVAERMSASNGMTTASGIRTGNTIFNFTGDIKTDNPIAFMGQLKDVLDKYMDNYWITKLSESRVR